MKTLQLLVLLLPLSLNCQAHWQKIDKQGEPVDIKMGPWHCAKDQNSGLIWEVKSWHEDQHYYKATYTYFDEKTNDGIANGGSCQQGYEWYPCDVSDYITYMNTTAYCGITTWRLPTIKELQTLIYHKNLEGELKINRYIFPRNTRSRYLTSTLSQSAEGAKVTMMDFLKLRIENRSLDTVANVRLVSN